MRGLTWQGEGPVGKQPQIDPCSRLPVRWGRRPSSKQADDPCRTIEIVALTGQLCATDQLTPDHDCTRYSKSARLGPYKYGTALFGPDAGDEKHNAARAEYDRLAALAWSPRPLKSPRSSVCQRSLPLGSAGSA
jgi:hypothetical protein